MRECVAREDGPHQGRETRRLLVRRCHATAARAYADVANAAVTAETGQLPSLGHALADGQVSREHLDLSRRCIERIPRALLDSHAEAVDQVLTDNARAWNPRDAAGLAEHVLAVIAPDSTDRYDPDALARRQLHTSTDSTGMLLVHGQLDPAAGHKFKAVLDHLADLNRTLNPPGQRCADSESDVGTGEPDQSALDVLDLRTTGQRNADAFARMVDLAAEQLALTEAGCGTDGSLRSKAARAVPRIVVQATVDQLAGATGAGAATLDGGALLSHGTLTRLACDAVFDRVLLRPTGQLLQMATLGRLATDAQTTALAARDGGCVWPGCSAPPAHCDAHHVTWWSRGGATTTDNLCLLCSRHHTEIHIEQWQIEMRDGVPWFIPPQHLDSSRRPVRNTFRDAVARARAFGEQLRLGLDPPTPDLGGDPALEQRRWLD